MRLPTWLAILGLVACDGGQSGENAKAWVDPACEGITFETADPTATPLGFSATELVASLESPAGVAWTDTSLDGTVTDALSFTGFTLDGPVRVADLGAVDPSCSLGDRGRKLVVRVAFDAELGDGDVVGQGTVELWASDLDPAEILAYPERTLPVTLSGTYGEALDGWANDHFETVDGVFLVLRDSWASLGVELEALHPDSSTVLWRGIAEP